MATITQATADRLRDQRLLWLRDNRGVLTRIAKELGVSQAFVRIVYHGGSQSRDGSIENELARLGAPGFVGKAKN